MKIYYGVTEKKMEPKKEKKSGLYVVSYRIGNKRGTKKFTTKAKAKDFHDNFLVYAKGKRTTSSYNEVEDRMISQVTIVRALMLTIDEELKQGKIGESTHYLRRHQVSLLTKEEKGWYLGRFNKNFIASELRKRCSEKSPSGEKFKYLVITFKKIDRWAKANNYESFGFDLNSIDTKIVRNNPPQKTYSLKDHEKFLDYARDESKPLYHRRKAAACVLNMECGLRIAELAALAVKDIDLTLKTLYVHRTVTKNSSGRYIIGTKTKTKVSRTISLFKNSIEMIEFIIKVNKVLALPNPHGLLLPPPVPREIPGLQPDYFFSGQGLAVHLLGTQTNPSMLLQFLGIEFLNSHNAFRKTCGTLLANNARKLNVPYDQMVESIQRRLGHLKASTTMDSYIKPKQIPVSELENIFHHKDDEIELESLTHDELLSMVKSLMKK